MVRIGDGEKEAVGEAAVPTASTLGASEIERQAFKHIFRTHFLFSLCGFARQELKKMNARCRGFASMTSALWRPRQKNCREFEASLGRQYSEFQASLG